MAKPWWLWILEALSGALSKQDLARAGATPEQLSGAKTFSIPLGSGYSVEAERQMNVEKLKRICDEIIADPNLEPRDGLTFCNYGVRRVAYGMGCHDFGESDLANRMVDIMSSWAGWRSDTAERAADHAMKGGLAVAGKKGERHGHVAVVYPVPCSFSGTWGIPVCVVSNIGKRNGLMKASEAYPVAEEPPAYYLWGETA